MLSIVIEQKNLSQKKLTTTITYVNPSQSITNNQLKNFAQSLISLTTNSYIDAELVNKTDIDESREPTKIEPTLTIGSWSAITYQDKSGVQADITYNGDGNLFANTTKLVTFYGSNPIKLFVGTTDSFTGTLYATEGDTYAAKSVNFSRNT